MKAAVCYEIGKPMVVEEVDLDPPQKGEVRVRMAAVAICHSDVRQIAEGNMGRLPFVSGHECAGYVEEVGEGVESVKPGDPAVVSHVSSCGKCRYCISGFSHLCEKEWLLDKECRIVNKKGQRMQPIIGISGFAEEVIVDESQVVKISRDMPMDRAALLSCGVITGWGAVVNRAQVKPNSNVVVIGTGGVGNNCLQGAAFVGAGKIIAVDIIDEKLESAKEFGATHVINSKKEDAVQAVKDLTEGRGADYVFLAVGGDAILSQGFSMTAPRGMTVIIGLPNQGQHIASLPIRDFIKDERVITGGYMGSSNIQIDMPYLVDLYLTGRLKLDELISNRYTLEQINEAIESSASGQVIRNVIMFE